MPKICSAFRKTGVVWILVALHGASSKGLPDISSSVCAGAIQHRHQLKGGNCAAQRQNWLPAHTQGHGIGHMANDCGLRHTSDTLSAWSSVSIYL